MKEKLINDFEIRCHNHRCLKRTKCKRYVQFGLDFRYKQNGNFETKRFDEKNCKYQIIYE